MYKQKACLVLLHQASCKCYGVKQYNVSPTEGATEPSVICIICKHVAATEQNLHSVQTLFDSQQSYAPINNLTGLLKMLKFNSFHLEQTLPQNRPACHIEGPYNGCPLVTGISISTLLSVKTVTVHTGTCIPPSPFWCHERKMTSTSINDSLHRSHKLGPITEVSLYYYCPVVVR